MVKGRKCHALQIAAVICLLSVVVMSCKKADTYIVLPETMEEETEQDTESMFSESEEETEQDTESILPEFKEDTVAQSLLCLKNADTRALVGLSFGDALDYDGYEMLRWSEDEVCYYRREACAYGDVGLVFDGRGNGFSGLKQYWSGNFFGIILGEDMIDAFTDVLGEPDTWKEKASGRETALWATWNFEDAMLSVRINEGKVRAIKYLANGTIADAQETPSDETDLGKDRQTAQERLYDIWGKKVAEVSYEYIPEMPFLLVTQAWNFTAGFSPVPLIRNQKMWFYKEQAQFDAEGKFCAYANVANKENDGSEYFPYSCRIVYDTDGRTQAIQEELQEEDIESEWGWWDDSIDYSGQIMFDYDTDGTIKHAEYVRSSYTHGTTDYSGTIDYDENGRMIENDYYITHGSHTDIFLYEGDFTMPWCVLHWCSFAPGFENIYLFLPEL